ncbi:Lsr2 protein [Modestobacter sp. DSM 44400]|uniref:histone-like nucleoid-structuring protein Lsr2 n=1 Tax=Modestobacter sp. DSM 44400 TaxID=1550230 RepID=UPI0008954C67|nr:Lsr2 family protein [Modestobacter sp. DSM 44400]SDY87607.1 Lsr2 protein [Modestobacter sp. DSM 44400]
MARKTTILLEDDLTGEVLEEGRGETVAFALDGQSYEIDLSGENSTQLRADPRRFIDAGRKVSGTRASGPGRSSTTGSSASPGRNGTGAIRAWARENGHELSGRGRISGSVIKAYDAAH